MSYIIYIIEQNTGNRNTWILCEFNVIDKVKELLKSQKQSEIIIIEKR